MTNFEKIKNMSVEELAETLNDSFSCDCCPIKEFCDYVGGFCTDTWIKWLESEVEEWEAL